MRAIPFILAVLTLTGCAANGGFVTTEVVTARAYVVRTAPDTLKTLPPLPPTLTNPRTATNAQVATWINNTEAYVAALEAQIQTLVNFYEAPVSTAEIGSLQPVTPRSPATPTPGRVIQPQTTATPIEPAPAPQGFVSRFLRPR